MNDGRGVDTGAWRSLLGQWNKELVQDPDALTDLPPEVSAAGWLGSPPASDDNIKAAEERLEVTLPPSYCAFLQVTNGWYDTGRFGQRIWSVGEIDWYIDQHRDLVHAWMEGESWNGPPAPVPDEQYFNYGPEQQPYTMRSEYLPQMLEVSDVGDGVYLLNPRVVTPEGEWEAWFFADWLAGAVRYRTFWDMMNAEYENYLRLKDDLEHDRDGR